MLLICSETRIKISDVKKDSYFDKEEMTIDLHELRNSSWKKYFDDCSGLFKMSKTKILKIPIFDSQSLERTSLEMSKQTSNWITQIINMREKIIINLQIKLIFDKNK